MLCKLLLVAMLAAGAEALRFAARPTATRTSAAVTMSEMSRRGALVAAAVLASGGTPAHASDLASKVAALDADASERNAKGAPDKHTPAVTTKSKSINVLSKIEFSVPHVMDKEKPHFIEFMWLKDMASGEVVAVKAFKATDASPPTLTASISKGRTLAPLLYCNLHGLWEGEAFTI